MPKKPNKGQRWESNRSGDKNYYDHDDRGPRRMESDTHFIGNRPRVSFKNQSGSRGRKDIKHLRLAIQQNLDDDVTMGSSTSNVNGRSVGYRGRGRGGGALGSSRGRDDRSRVTRGALAPANCYKVHIPYGSKFDKEFLISTLQNSIAPDVFVPIMYKIVGQDAIFHVDDQKIAQKLVSCDRKITVADGFKIVVKVHPFSPESKLDNDTKNKIKLAMAKRYIPDQQSLNLSRFHLDSDLVNDYYFPLFRPSVFMAVLDIMAKEIPMLRALNLDDNKFGIIERMHCLASKFPDLKTLYLGNNKLTNVNQLESIKNLKLEDLILLGNPLCLKYKNRHEDYISDVQKKFPKLKRLDGMTLTPPISFELADEDKVTPPSKRVCTVSPEARETANRFLQQYFTLYDSNSRSTLLDAYEEHACFSLTIASLDKKFSRYFNYNRNFYEKKSSNQRFEQLKQGKLPIVTLISTLPKTQHFLDSFTLDIGHATEHMMIITVTGLFKEVDTPDQLIRFFHRTFVIVPVGAGFCIKSEILHLAHPTATQEKSILNPPAPVQVQSPQQQQQGPSTSTAAAAVVEPSLEIQQQMVLTLSNATNMNLDWSLRCLRDVQWNYDTALAAFHEFFKLGQIPPDAFKK